ncbi:hypothetical protein V8C26DRAFT_387184 [Trichoderma gracile]
MRPRSVALFAACIPLGFCNANDPAPRCAVDCASNIRNDHGALDLKVICGEKLMTNSLFQCLITSCPHDAYSPAVAHVILACSDLGIAIGPLYPVEVQHANLVKAQDLLAPSTPAAYSTPSDSSPQSPEQLTLSFDISVDLKCNSGSDGLVTVSLPLPVPPLSTASPPLPSPAPNSDPSEGEGDGQGGNGGGNDESDGESENDTGNGSNGGDGGNGNGDNGNGDGDCENSNGDDGDNGDGGDGDGASSIPKPTQASADPNATSSSQPDSASPSAQDPADGQTPSSSTGGGVDGDPAATPAPSASPAGGDPVSQASSSPASPASSPSPASPASQASSASPAAPASPASTSPCATASPETGGLDPQDTNQSDPSSGSAGEGEEPQAPEVSSALPPAPASSTLAAASSSCSTADGMNVSVDPAPGPQVSQPAQPTSGAQPSSQSLSRAPVPVPSPVPSSSDDTTDPSSGGPPEYSSASDFETSVPDPSAEPLPQENQGSGAQAPSYGQSGLTLRSPTSLADDTPRKTPGPSEVTLWPTTKVNRTSHTTSAAGQHGSPISSCESDGKETLITAHTPRANLALPSDVPRGASPIADAQHGSLSSVTVKFIPSGETVAGTLLMTVLDTAPLATAAPTTPISNESVVGSGSSDSPAHSPSATMRATSDITPVQSGEAAKESSAPHVALVNGVSRTTPHLFTIALLIILVGGILLN